MNMRVMYGFLRKENAEAAVEPSDRANANIPAHAGFSRVALTANRPYLRAAKKLVWYIHASAASSRTTPPITIRR
jgi:hypothetical protein